MKDGSAVAALVAGLGFCLLPGPAGVAAAFAPSSSPAPACPRWAPSIEDGLAQAKAKNLPLMVALNMDRERGNEAMVAEVYTDPLVVAAAAKCICTIGSLSTHPDMRDAARGRMVCSKFGFLTCAEHKAVERVIRVDWLKKGPAEEVDSPQHFFLAPDGRRLFHRTWTVDAKELASLMARASEFCTPAALEVFDTLEGRLRRAGDPEPVVRAGAIEALAAMKDAAVDARLAEMARSSPDEGVQGDVLAAFAAAMNPARATLAGTMLGAKSPLTRMHAAAALEASRTPEALKCLTAALAREKDPEMRGYLYRSVSGCAPGDAGARGTVFAGLAEKGETVLPQVLVALGPWASEPAVFAALRPIALGREDWRIRAAAWWSIGLSGHREMAAERKDLKDDSKGRRLSRMADLALRRLAESVDVLEYRRALEQIARPPVEHPDEPR